MRKVFKPETMLEVVILLPLLTFGYKAVSSPAQTDEFVEEGDFISNRVFKKRIL